MVHDTVLDLLDLLTGSVGPQYCNILHPTRALENEILLADGWESYCDPAGRKDYMFRRPYERSLWVRRFDNRCTPELFLLTWYKFGKEMLREDAAPFWTDKDFTNNTEDNITLPTKVERASRISKYGARSGTPEYRREYYKDPENKRKQREAARRHAATRRAELAVAKVTHTEAFNELTERILGIPDLRILSDDDRPE